MILHFHASWTAIVRVLYECVRVYGCARPYGKGERDGKYFNWLTYINMPHILLQFTLMRQTSHFFFKFTFNKYILLYFFFNLHKKCNFNYTVFRRTKKTYCEMTIYKHYNIGKSGFIICIRNIVCRCTGHYNLIIIIMVIKYTIAMPTCGAQFAKMDVVMIVFWNAVGSLFSAKNGVTSSTHM